MRVHIDVGHRPEVPVEGNSREAGSGADLGNELAGLSPAAYQQMRLTTSHRIATLDEMLTAVVAAHGLEALDASVLTRVDGDDTARQAAGVRA